MCSPPDFTLEQMPFCGWKRQPNQRGPHPCHVSPWKRRITIQGLPASFPTYILFCSITNNSGIQMQSLRLGSCQLPDFSLSQSPHKGAGRTTGRCHGEAVTSEQRSL